MAANLELANANYTGESTEVYAHANFVIESRSTTADALWHDILSQCSLCEEVRGDASVTSRVRLMVVVMIMMVMVVVWVAGVPRGVKRVGGGAALYTSCLGWTKRDMSVHKQGDSSSRVGGKGRGGAESISYCAMSAAPLCQAHLVYRRTYSALDMYVVQKRLLVRNPQQRVLSSKGR